MELGSLHKYTSNLAHFIKLLKKQRNRNKNQQQIFSCHYSKFQTFRPFQNPGLIFWSRKLSDFS